MEGMRLTSVCANVSLEKPRTGKTLSTVLALTSLREPIRESHSKPVNILVSDSDNNIL